jgi:hypothetical protein
MPDPGAENAGWGPDGYAPSQCFIILLDLLSGVGSVGRGWSSGALCSAEKRFS